MKTIWLIIKILIVSLLLVSIAITGTVIYYKTNYEQTNDSETNLVLSNNQIQKNNTLANENVARDLKVELPGDNVHVVQEEQDWRLILVNAENPLPKNFKIELTKINGNKEFDSRAASELTRNDASSESSRSSKYMGAISL